MTFTYMMKFCPELGDNLRAAREDSGLTQDELAYLTRLSQESISRIETGIIKNPQLDTILKLCCALHIDLTELIYGN